jgi:hypothetical protein
LARKGVKNSAAGLLEPGEEMTCLWDIAVAVGALLVLALAYNTFWWVVETVRPFTYRNVPLEDVQDHILAVFRRGMNKCQLRIACEQTGKQLRFRKTYRYGKPGFAFHLIVPRLNPADPSLSCAHKSIELLGLPCSVTHDSKKFLTLDVDSLANLEKAKAAADIIMADIVCVSPVANIDVQVKGNILRVDGYVDGKMTVADQLAIYNREFNNPRPRPYNWNAYRRMNGVRARKARAFGYFCGKILAWLFRR